MNNRVHVLPINDKLEHVEVGVSCWCKPTVTPEGVIVHNAADNREVQEWWDKNIAPIKPTEGDK